MQERTLKYKNASRPLLEQGMRELAAGDLRQASEKGWGAVAEMIKAVAELRGWEHNDHAKLHQVVGRVVDEAGDKEIFDLFSSATALHVNFYEDWSPHNEVARGLENVDLFLRKLEVMLPQ